MNDSIRVRISSDDPNEFGAFLEVLKKAGVTIQPFSYSVFEGKRQILRLKLNMPPSIQNPTELDFD